MKALQYIKAIGVVLACWGFVFPYQTVMAGEGSPRLVKPALSAPVILDVTLTDNGTAVGRVVDEKGAPIANLSVSVRQGKDQIATAVTDKDGYFSVKNLRGGVYQVVAGRGFGIFRFWSEKAAPPKANKYATIVSSGQIVRGQNGDLFDFTGIGGGTYLQLFGLAAAVTTITLTSINLSKLNSLQDDVDRIPKSP